MYCCYTLINRFDERFNVSFLTENKGREIGIVDRDACGIVSTVLQSAEAIEENLQDVSSVSVHVVIQIRKYSTHFLFSSSLSKPPDLRFIVFSFIILWGPFCLTSLWLRELAFCPPGGEGGYSRHSTLHQPFSCGAFPFDGCNLHLPLSPFYLFK